MLWEHGCKHQRWWVDSHSCMGGGFGSSRDCVCTSVTERLAASSTSPHAACGTDLASILKSSAVTESQLTVLKHLTELPRILVKITKLELDNILEELSEARQKGSIFVVFPL